MSATLRWTWPTSTPGSTVSHLLPLPDGPARRHSPRSLARELSRHVRIEPTSDGQVGNRILVPRGDEAGSDADSCRRCRGSIGGTVGGGRAVACGTYGLFTPSLRVCPMLSSARPYTTARTKEEKAPRSTSTSISRLPRIVLADNETLLVVRAAACSSTTTRRCWRRAQRHASEPQRDAARGYAQRPPDQPQRDAPRGHAHRHASEPQRDPSGVLIAAAASTR